MPRSMRGRILVLVAVALLAGGSLCVFDADDGTGLDLCGVVLLPVAVPRPRSATAARR